MTIPLSILGKGAFGSALQAVYTAAGHPVRHLGRGFPAQLPGAYVLLAVPTRALADVLARLQPAPGQVLVLCCKGVLANGQVPSSLLPPDQPWAVLSGPGFADELNRGLPTVHSLATTQLHAQSYARDLSTTSFRLYWSADPIGVQVCGAFKNVLAIAAGITEGLGLGENARAALMSRGAAELRAVIAGFGGQEATIWSPAGLGDLSLTCNSAKSRNFRFGRMLAQGVPVPRALADLGTVEGLSALTGLARVCPPDEMPITAMLSAVVAADVTPQEAVQTLMQRPIRAG